MPATRTGPMFTDYAGLSAVLVLVTFITVVPSIGFGLLHASTLRELGPFLRLPYTFIYFHNLVYTQLAAIFT